MEIFNNPNLKPAGLLKIGLVSLVAIIAIVFFAGLIGASLRSMSFSLGGVATQEAMDYRSGFAGNFSAGMPDGKARMNDKMLPELSLRNAAGSDAVAPNTAASGDEEGMEVVEYTARVDTRRLGDDCAKISVLKSRDDVIFENATLYERGCDYYFKAKKESVAEITALIKELDPRDFNENTETIKRQIDDFTSETEILQKKIASLEATLAEAIRGYDEISALAARKGDAESLTKVVDGKINAIERLTQQKVQASAELERLSRAKAEQLDRLDYAYFNVHIIENKFVDGRVLVDSWRDSLRSFVVDANKALQGLSLGLLVAILVAIQVLVYLFLGIFIAKFVWRQGKKIWSR